MAYEIVIRFPDEMRQPLQEVAKAQDRSINWIVKAAVAAWLAAQPVPPPEHARSANSTDDAPASPIPLRQREVQEAGAG